MDTEKLLKIIVNTLDDKKASDIKVLKTTDVTMLGDYFVIADADNITHVKSLVDEVEYVTKHEARPPKRIEKDNTSNWIILDYSDIVVHIFYKEAREFYNLDGLWADAKEIPAEDITD